MRETFDADELVLFGDNDEGLYFSSYIPCIKNLVRKVERGVYDQAKSAKLFEYHAKRVRAEYLAQFPGSRFAKGAVQEAAKYWADDFAYDNWDLYHTTKKEEE
jgi:hypothetical protein